MYWIDNIKQIMKDHGINIEYLHQEISRQGGQLSRNSISNILNGRNNPKVETLQQIARAMGVPLSEIFMTDSGNVLNGYVEYSGKIYRVASFDDLRELLKFDE